MDEIRFPSIAVEWQLDRNNAMLVTTLLRGLNDAGLTIRNRPRRRAWH